MSNSAILAGKAFVQLFADDTALARGLKGAEKRLKAWGTSVQSMGKKAFLAGSALAAPLAAASQIFADMGGNLDDISQRTGVSASALSELGYAAQMGGTDLATLEGALTKMNVKLAEAQQGNKTAAAGFEYLGLSVEKLTKLSPEEQFLAIGDAVGQIEDPALRANAAMDVFGKSGVNLLPMLGDGAASIEEMRQKARDLGLTMSDESAAAAAQFGDDVDNLWLVLKNSTVSIGAQVVPMLTKFATTVTTGIVAVNNWIKENGDLIRMALGIAGALMAAGVAIYAAGTALTIMGAIAGGVATGISAIGAAIGFLLSPIGLVIAGLAGLATWFLTSTETGAEALDWLGGVFMDLKADALTAFGAIGDALASGNIALAAKVLWSLLKMEFQKGINWINQKWQGWKGFFLEIFTNAVYGISRVFTDVWAGIQVTWFEALNGMKNGWTNFTTYLSQKWNQFKGFFGKVWARIKESFGGDNADKEVERINNETAAEDHRLDDDRKRIIAARNAEKEKSLTAVERDRKGAQSALNQMQAQELADIQKAQDASIRAGEEAVAAAKAEFATAVGEAKAARADSERAARDKPKSKLPNAVDLDGIGNQLKGAKTAGTFSGSVAARIGGSNLGERQLKATERVVAAVEKGNAITGKIIKATQVKA